jgi:hypothetical protein
VAYGAVVLWMVLSALVILVNKYILTVSARVGGPVPVPIGSEPLSQTPEQTQAEARLVL